MFHQFEDFGLPSFVCSVPFLTENGRGENMRQRERESGEEESCEEEEEKIRKHERREERGERRDALSYFRIKIMHWVATVFPNALENNLVIPW